MNVTGATFDLLCSVGGGGLLAVGIPLLPLYPLSGPACPTNQINGEIREEVLSFIQIIKHKQDYRDILVWLHIRAI